MTFPQLPDFLWDKKTVITAIFDPGYPIQVFFFFLLLITLVTLLIVICKVTKYKGNKNIEPGAILLA
ncbi:small integral membrane protein 42 [Perognathus longimembris pacificus]|uniref:small integral membrane protein 42 n=1 Tax=Perognathus longimembris pacificus TaxID=214514 RepID=UPI002019591E|nr:small integral membrane protein 42 [Perognathus longimembris pacificus]